MVPKNCPYTEVSLSELVVSLMVNHEIVRDASREMMDAVVDVQIPSIRRQDACCEAGAKEHVCSDKGEVYLPSSVDDHVVRFSVVRSVQSPALGRMQKPAVNSVLTEGPSKHSSDKSQRCKAKQHNKQNSDDWGSKDV